MKYSRKLFYTVLIAFGVSTVAPAQELTLSREQCVEIALRDNPSVIIADMEVKKVDYAKKEVMASLFPSIDFSASYQRSIELQTIRMNMGGESQSLKMGSDNTWNMGFSATMPLISPTLWKSISISKTLKVRVLPASTSSTMSTKPTMHFFSPSPRMRW